MNLQESLNNKSVKLGQVITKETIRWWDKYEEENLIILIQAQTGKGKSHMIKHNLSSYAREKDRKVLLLLNRSAPIEQFKAELKKEEIYNIKVESYQRIEEIIKKKNQKELDELNEYYYLVLDESHYFFDDSEFNADSEVSLHWVLKQNKFRIFMSATMDLMERYFKSILVPHDSDISYYKMLKFRTDYSYINLNFYKNDKAIEKLLETIPKDEKVMYFGSTKIAYELSKKYPDSAFICSSSNKTYRRYSNKKTLDSIINNEMFEEKNLFGTKVLDNGVNIKDDAVKHSIIDYDDIDTIIQVMGRKRINEDISERLNVYIKVPTKTTLSRRMSVLDVEVAELRTFMHKGAEAIINSMERKTINNKAIYDGIDENGKLCKKLNSVVFTRKRMNMSYYKRYLDEGFIDVICENLGLKEYKIIDEEIDTITLEEQLEQLLDVKLFKEGQNNLKEIIFSLIEVPKKNHNSLGGNTLNGFFVDKGYPYRLEVNLKETKGENRNKNYWLLKKLC